MSVQDNEIKVEYIEEPELEFHYGQTTDHPKNGLFLYGPHKKSARSKELSIGVIGTKDGLNIFRNWAIKLGGFIHVPPPTKKEKEIRLHLSNFPGIEETFGLIVSPGDFVERKIDHKKLDAATQILNQYEAVRGAVDLYIKEVECHDKNEEKSIDVWVFILPEFIFERCKPLARRSGLDLKEGNFGKKQKKKLDLPLFAGVIDQSDEEIFEDIPDFHRQVKARLLKLGHTSQIIRETSLAPEKFLNKAGYPIRNVQEPATIAWNIATGLYYKTQPDPPWKLASVRPDVCYIGLVFKQIPNHPKEHVCCAAQMFLNEGDAVVFRGANGPWKTNEYEYHLKAPEAKNLVAKVISTFKEKHGRNPKELFIHGRSGFSNEEWNAFLEASPKETNIIAVRIKAVNGDVKLFRHGDYPVIRGTAMIIDKRKCVSVG